MYVELTAAIYLHMQKKEVFDSRGCLSSFSQSDIISFLSFLHNCFKVFILQLQTCY